MADEAERGRYALSLGTQAAALGHTGLPLAYQGFDLARRIGAKLNDARLSAEALEGRAGSTRRSGAMPKPCAWPTKGRPLPRRRTPGIW